MVHCTLQIDTCEAGQTQTVIVRCFGINQSQVSQLIAMYHETNDVLTDHGLGDGDFLLQQTLECLPDQLFMILRLFVLNYVSSGKILMCMPIPELLTGDLTRLD